MRSYASCRLHWPAADAVLIGLTVAVPVALLGAAGPRWATGGARAAAAAPPLPVAQPDCVRVEVDKPRYLLAEPVGILLINGCTDLVEMPSPAPWSIRDEEDRPVYSPSVIQVVTVVPPGQRVDWSWDQHDQQGNPVPAGTYRLELRAARGNASMTYRARFEIAPTAPTETATAAPTHRPPPATATAGAGVACICQRVRDSVPLAAMTAAVAEPQRIGGWRQPVNPSIPPGPYNPRRECLTLANPNVPYHALFNTLVFRAGCP